MQLPLMLIINVSNAALGIMRQLVIMNVLGPIAFGIYNHYSVWINFGNYLDFGTNNGAVYKSLDLIKVRDFDGAKQIRQVIFKFTLVLGSLYLFIALTMIIAVKYFLLSCAFEDYIIALVLIAPLLMIQNILIVECRVQEKFVLFGSAILIGAMVSVLTVLIFGLGLSIDSVEIYVILTQCAVLTTIILILSNKEIKMGLVNINIKITFKKIKDLIIEGLPLTIQPILFVCHQAMDRIFYLNLMPQTQFGFYALGSALGSYLSIISSTFATRYSTKHISSTIESMSLEEYIRPIIITSVLVGALCLGFNLIAEKLFLYFLPKYGDGLELIYLTMCAYGLLFPILIILPLLMANNYKRIVIIQQIIIILTFWIAIKFLQGYDVTSKELAILTLSINLLFSLLMTNNVLALFKTTRIQKFIISVKIFMPYFTLAVIIPYTIFPALR